jgi:Helix-turn-helix domain
MCIRTTGSDHHEFSAGARLPTSNDLGRYFREQRIQHGLTFGQLAQTVGYRNVSRGSNKICCLEREGVVTEELLARIAEALGGSGAPCRSHH